jgi:predicted porin
MKKHLIAAAVAGALAVPAMAQVKLSGYVEAGITSVKTDGESLTTVNQFVGTPTLTISGSEDLGGGLKASFKLAQEFNVGTGVETDGTKGLFEESSISLSGGFGAIKLGRYNHAVRDNGGNYRFFGDIGRIDGDFRGINGKTNRTIQYSTPSFGGLVAHVAYSNDGAKDAATASPHTTSYGVFYKAGAINVGAGFTERDTDATRKAKVTTVGGSYNMGMAKIGLIYGEFKMTSNEKRDVTGVHLAIPLGSGMTVGGNYSMYESDQDSNSGSKVYTLAFKKDLSKRTSVVAAYASVDADTDGRGLGPASLVSVTNGKTNSGFGLAVTHKF